MFEVDSSVFEEYAPARERGRDTETETETRTKGKRRSRIRQRKRERKKERERVRERDNKKRKQKEKNLGVVVSVIDLPGVGFLVVAPGDGSATTSALRTFWKLYGSQRGLCIGFAFGSCAVARWRDTCPCVRRGRKWESCPLGVFRVGGPALCLVQSFYVVFRCSGVRSLLFFTCTLATPRKCILF